MEITSDELDQSRKMKNDALVQNAAMKAELEQLKATNLALEKQVI